MADRKISELTALSSANLQDADLLPIVDFDITNSDSSPANTSKQTKSITIGDLKTSIFTNPTFSETITITRSGTGVPTAPQLILKDADGTNETTHIYNHSGRTAIVGRNENAKGIIDFIQDDGTTQNTAMKISSQSFVGIDEVTPRAPLHINVTDFPAGTPRGIIIQRDSNVDGEVMGTISFNNGENLDSPENNSPKFDGTIARIRTTLQSNSDDNSPNPDAGGSMALQTKDEEGSLETRIEIRETGNIGIGTSTPDSLLHLDGGNSSVEMILETYGAGGCKISFADEADNDVGQISYNHLDNSLTIKTNATDAIGIDSSQNAVFAGSITTNTTVTIGNDTSTGNNLTFNSQGNNAQIIDFQEGGTSALKITHTPADDTDKLKILFDNDSVNYPNGQLVIKKTGGIDILGGGGVSLNHETGAQFKKQRTDGGTDYAHAILNNTDDTTPINVIRRMSQSDYNGITPDANTLYIIT